MKKRVSPDENPGKFDYLKLYSTIVVEGGISPEYFWYEMDPAEISPLTESINNKIEREWRIVQQQTFITMLPHFKEGTNPEPDKIFPTPFDKPQTKNSPVTPPTKEEAKIQKAKMKEMSKILNP